MQRLIVLVSCLLLSGAVAQGRLNPPNYYLSQLPELKAGDVLNGELTAASGQNFKDGSYLDMFVMYGEEGERATLLAASLEFDTFLSIFDSDGWLVASADDSVHGTDAELVLTLPRTGRYLVVVSGYSDFDLGRYTVSRTPSLSQASSAAVPLSVPGTYLGTFNEMDAVLVPYLEAPGVRFVVELTEPSALDITAASAFFDTFLMVTDADGALIAENDDENYSETTNWATDSRVFAEYAPGTYYVYLTSLYGVPFGDYSLNVRRFVAVD